MKKFNFGIKHQLMRYRILSGAQLIRASRNEVNQ